MLKKIGWGVGIAFILSSPFTVRAFTKAPSIEVNVEPVTTRVIRGSVLSSGNLIYKDEARLSPEIIGRVSAITVNEGDKVEKGQILLYLDDQDIREMIALQRAQVEIDTAMVERQKINIVNAQESLDRVNRLVEHGMVTRSAFDDAAYKVKTAKADLHTSELNVKRTRAALNQAETRLRQTVIRAPISGTVVAIGIKPGETAVPSVTGVPGSTLVTVVKENSILVDLNVDENDITKLHLNGEAYINCPTLPADGVKGEVTDIGMSPRNASRNIAANDPTGRSYSVRVKIQKDYGLRAGMSCRAKMFTSNPKPTLSIPVQAVLSDQLTDNDGVSMSRTQAGAPERYVFVAVNGRAEKRVVTTGGADDRYLEIKSGLKENEKIIIGPPRILNSIHNQSPVLPLSS
ncbi:MAG: efflux RND transporter periplasmic adaptor subunit [Bdellovibrionales bacterium]|nr:efflux RND transporter periplasmic adaptor subunit [Massilia sp.]